MQTVFYERLFVLLFALRKRTHNKAGDVHRQILVQMSQEWHGHLRLLINERKKGPNPKTTKAWISMRIEERREPRGVQHREVIVASLKQYVRYQINKQENSADDHEIDSFVGNFADEHWYDIAKRLSVSNRDVRNIFPELGAILEYIEPDTTVRKIYNQTRANNKTIIRIEDEIINKSYYLYRCKAVTEVLYRTTLKFERDSNERLVCVWRDGTGEFYRGFTYVGSSSISIVLVKDGSLIAVDFVFINLSYSWNDPEWGGTIMGLTDRGNDPCCGKVIVVERIGDVQLQPSSIELGEWSAEQYNSALKFIGIKNEFTQSYALIADQNFFAACRGRYKLLIRDQ